MESEDIVDMEVSPVEVTISVSDAEDMGTIEKTVMPAPPSKETTSEKILLKGKKLRFISNVVGDTTNLTGRLKKCIKFWDEIGVNSAVRETITQGYKIPFLTTPPTMFSENNKTALNHPSFIENEINSLLQTGRILEVSHAPHIVNPLSVSENKDGTYRLILDLSIPNKYIFKDKIKFDDWRVMLEFVKQGDYLYKFDIIKGKGYYHVDVGRALHLSWILLDIWQST